MEIKAGRGFSWLATTVGAMLEKDAGMSRALANSEFQIGLAGEPGFGVPAHATDSAIFAGDSAHLGDIQKSAAIKAALESCPEKVQIHPHYNAQTKKWDQKYVLAGDADFNPLAGQLFSPWNITYLSRVWKEPLAYSRAKEIIRTESAGSNPFAEIFTMFLEQYAGWGVIGQTGSFQNTTTNDVNVMNGMMSANIINMMGTYSITREEKDRTSWGPLGSSPIARKQSYLNYVMDMMDAILIYFGNEETETKGVLDINPIRLWDTGKSMKEIFESTTTTTRGSDAFRLLAGHINDFLSAADNKFQHIKIAVSPAAYNCLQSMPYSDTYDATVAMRTFEQSYLAGKGPNGSTPTIEWIAEPLLKASTPENPNPFNPNSFDLMVMNAPEIGGGPNDEAQPTNFYATVLDKFVFPVIPGMYNDQYKTLRRVAGVIAPIPAATRVYAGFGVQ